MPHSEPEGPLVKRQKLNVAAKASAAAKQGSRIFAPFRVRYNLFPSSRVS